MIDEGPEVSVAEGVSAAEVEMKPGHCARRFPACSRVVTTIMYG